MGGAISPHAVNLHVPLAIRAPGTLVYPRRARRFPAEPSTRLRRQAVDCGCVSGIRDLRDARRAIRASHAPTRGDLRSEPRGGPTERRTWSSRDWQATGDRQALTVTPQGPPHLPATRSWVVIGPCCCRVRGAVQSHRHGMGPCLFLRPDLVDSRQCIGHGAPDRQPGAPQAAATLPCGGRRAPVTLRRPS